MKVTKHRHEAAQFISESSAARAATRLAFQGFLTAIAAERKQDEHFHTVTVFDRNRQFAGFAAEPKGV